MVDLAYAAVAPAAPARPGLPLQVKALFITTVDRTGSWLAEAFAADGAAHVVLEEAIGVAAGCTRLRGEVFDAVLVSHHPQSLDALALVEALRAGGTDEPLIVLGYQPPQEMDALCYEAGADEYCCLAETTVRGLLWRLTRAIERFALSRENRRLVQAERQRLQQEHHEAERLLEQQRALIADLEGLRHATAPDRMAKVEDEAAPQYNRGATRLAAPAANEQAPLPGALVNHYRDLLRTYVIMGAGNLTTEMASLGEMLVASHLSARRTMQLHVEALEELVAGLGNRSARHVMNRADILALEVLGYLADGYRQRYYERRRPAQQQLLPGFNPPPGAVADLEPLAA
jgi:hypothetical protein